MWRTFDNVHLLHSRLKVERVAADIVCDVRRDSQVEGVVHRHSAVEGVMHRAVGDQAHLTRGRVVEVVLTLILLFVKFRCARNVEAHACDV